MNILMNNQEKIVSREEIIEELWDTDEFISENTLTVNVNRLRKKLDYKVIILFIIYLKF